MDTHFAIKKIAVLGAGVMGAQIAAHFVNAGFEVLLFDLPNKQEPLNGIVDNAIQLLKKLKPSPIASLQFVNNVQARNYQEHLGDLKKCDLIVEAVAERFDIKQALYDKISNFINDKAIFVTNTSGLSINKLGELLPSNMQSRFCGVHFFNPPRYMHLLELIPSLKTDAKLLDQLEQFFVRFMGKGVVRAKDTPNFIANRIGVFSMLSTVYHAERLGIPFEVVDALTGSLLGRPKSATFRTMDVVGLDTMMHVVNTMQQNLTDDPWHQFYQLPAWLTQLIENGALGQKTRAGIYKKEGKLIKVWRPESQSYEEQNATVDADVSAIFENNRPNEIYFALQQSSSKQAQFLAACFSDLFHYSAYHLKDIAETPRDIDLAIRWGFGWSTGPFETWQAAGVSSVLDVLNKSIASSNSMVQAPLPEWVTEVTHFYSEEGAFHPVTFSFQSPSSLPVYKRQLMGEKLIGEAVNKGETILETSAVRLWTLDQQVAILSFKSKANCIGSDVLAGMHQTIDKAEQSYKGLVIWQDSQMNFSVGANLKQFSQQFSAEKADELRAAVYDFQRVALRLKYSAIPTIAAVRGRALGGGCEFLMHCDDVVAGLESYVGLVEVGVGLLPAGGGLKELAIRAHEFANGLPNLGLLERYFKMVAMAEVATSAFDARDKAFFKPSAQIVMNSHEVLYLAIERANYLALNNYLPPVSKGIAVMGRDAAARLNMLVVNMAKGGFISEHDSHIAEKIAYVLSGGDLDEGTVVDEEWFLRLELDAFIELAQTEKTQARVQHLLESGKPLRN